MSSIDILQFYIALDPGTWEWRYVHSMHLRVNSQGHPYQSRKTQTHRPKLCTPCIHGTSSSTPPNREPYVV